jgi:hypothetical protein
VSLSVAITRAPSPAAPGELITYGHSFLSEQGLPDRTTYYARLVAASLGLTYPTSRGGRADDLKRAVGGSLIRDTAVRALGNAMPPHPGGAALVIIQGLINSARLNGAFPADLATARNSLHTLMAVVNSASRREVTETETFTFTGSTMPVFTGVWSILGISAAFCCCRSRQAS